MAARRVFRNLSQALNGVLRLRNILIEKGSPSLAVWSTKARQKFGEEQRSSLDEIDYIDIVKGDIDIVLYLLH